MALMMLKILISHYILIIHKKHIINFNDLHVKNADDPPA